MTQQQPPPKPAHQAAATRDWTAYFERVATGTPRDTLLEALDRFAKDPAPDADAAALKPLAIDLGSGSGRDTLELLRRGWRVHAIDGTPEAHQRLLARPEFTPTPDLTLTCAGFESIAASPDPLPRCRLLNASFALPFCPPSRFEALWAKALACIEPGGRFAGQLFGDRDTWATIPDRSHQTAEQARALLQPLEIESFREDEKPGNDAEGQKKHWHVFHIVAKKPH